MTEPRLPFSPFITGRVVQPEEFVNRKQEVRQSLSLLATGQSVAFTGGPRIGKTSLLLYLLHNPQLQGTLASQTGRRLVLNYMDSQTWPSDFTQAHFWERALQPLLEAGLEEGLRETYERSRAEDFSTFTLERLLARIQSRKWQLVLFLDEFDTILELPMLRKTEFYGGLRSLASRYGTALTLVIASRQPLSELHERTQEYTRTGSPFFNFVKELPLKPFERKDALALLERVGDRFTREEQDWLLNLTGGFPYLLQIAGDALWHAYEEGQNAEERQRTTYQTLFRVVDAGMRDIWHHWTPDMRQAFAIVALDILEGRLGPRAFDMGPLHKTLKNLNRALLLLEEQGYLRRAGTASGYTFTAWIMLGWVVEDLLRLLRSEEDLASTLAREEWLGPLKRGEKEALEKAIRGLGKLVKGAQEMVGAIKLPFA